jgi:hypothetical protein
MVDKAFLEQIRQMNHVDVGRMLGVALFQLENAGDTPLPTLLRVLADKVEEIERETS